jgi:hypothetical protein
MIVAVIGGSSPLPLALSLRVNAWASSPPKPEAGILFGDPGSRALEVAREVLP